MSRGGVSLLEVVIIGLIVALAAIPLLNSFGSFSWSMHRTTRETGAVYAGQAIMEQVLERIRVADDGSFDLSGLAEAGARVAAEAEGERSRYFARFEDLQGSGLHGITPERDPELYRELSRYTCTVEVIPGAGAGLDSDGDGRPEDDLAEVGVTLSWEVPGGSRRSHTLWSIMTSHRRGARP